MSKTPYGGSRSFASAVTAVIIAVAATLAVWLLPKTAEGQQGNFPTGGVTFPVLAPNGSAVAPSYSFTNATGTGVYNISGDVGLAVGGTPLVDVGAGIMNVASSVLRAPAFNASTTGYQVSGTILISVTAPTIAAAGCGGAAASIVSPNGTGAFKVNVGTTPGSACTFTMPAATNGWNVTCNDITTQSTSVFVQKQTGAESTTSVTITNFSDVAVATAFVASDILKCTAGAD